MSEKFNFNTAIGNTNSDVSAIREGFYRSDQNKRICTKLSDKSKHALGVYSIRNIREFEIIQELNKYVRDRAAHPDNLYVDEFPESEKE